MTVCKNCGNEITAPGSFCENCKSAASITEQEIEKRLADLKIIIKNKQYEKALEEYRALADMGCTEAEKEYAAILEKGQLVPKNLDLAMKYFYRAALKNDAYSAYRYSRLAARANKEIGSFWLIYSAVLGCAAAYPETAEEFSSHGYEEDAHYFTWLAASFDDTDSIVAMAKRYYDGIGTEPSEQYAKWYIDKLRIPPIYAIKLAYKLRNAVAKEPPPITLKNYGGLLRQLAAKAKECSFDCAYFRLTEMLAERGEVDAEVSLAELLFSGRGCKQNITDALKLLTKASAIGNLRANMMLGNLHFNEELFPKDAPAAISYYKRAGELGSHEAYELIGDIYYTGSGLSVNIPKAIEFYDLAAAAGSAAAKGKSSEIKRERNSLFERALTAQGEDAFRLYSLSASLGHPAAKLKLAGCLEHGIGTKINRKNAFSLYREAAELGSTEAFLEVGRCYAHGMGTPLDYRKARVALCRAERLGEERASAFIKELMESKKRKLSSACLSTAMRLVYQGKTKEAIKHLEAAVYLENPKAIYTLGCLYEFGVGVDCDKQKAYDMYEKAFALLFRDPRAKYKLAVLKLVKSKI